MAGKNRQALDVLLNGRKNGRLTRDKGGAIAFQYDPAWLDWTYTMPVSLSLPLREERFIGSAVTSVFDNLLPDNIEIRKHLAERTSADGIDPLSLLYAIGKDCVGALQFVPEDFDPGDTTMVRGKPVSDEKIEDIILNLKRVPLGIGADVDFRISIAGVQEKTALLRSDGRWEIPEGGTPTTHILKPAIGKLDNGVDLSRSVENEHFCLTLLAQLGIPAAHSEIADFGKTRALVVERFDRIRIGERLIRRPQEDTCQALGIAWTRKYENEGGPGILSILNLLQASDDAHADRTLFFTAQIIFWLLGATDGHAKNFSIHLSPGGRFRMAPLYDVLSAQPNVDARQIRANGFKLAMAVGDSRHYAVNGIVPRHYRQMADKAGMLENEVQTIMIRLLMDIPSALERTIGAMPQGFPQFLTDSIAQGMTTRLRLLE